MQSSQPPSEMLPSPSPCCMMNQDAPPVPGHFGSSSGLRQPLPSDHSGCSAQKFSNPAKAAGAPAFAPMLPAAWRAHCTVAQRSHPPFAHVSAHQVMLAALRSSLTISKQIHPHAPLPPPPAPPRPLAHPFSARCRFRLPPILPVCACGPWCCGCFAWFGCHVFWCEPFMEPSGG